MQPVASSSSSSSTATSKRRRSRKTSPATSAPNAPLVLPTSPPSASSLLPPSPLQGDGVTTPYQTPRGPSNSFILFRSAYIDKIKEWARQEEAKNPEAVTIKIQQPEYSKVISKVWNKEMTEEQKAVWSDLAHERKRVYKAQKRQLDEEREKGRRVEPCEPKRGKSKKDGKGKGKEAAGIAPEHSEDEHPAKRQRMGDYQPGVDPYTYACMLDQAAGWSNAWGNHHGLPGPFMFPPMYGQNFTFNPGPHYPVYPQQGHMRVPVQEAAHWTYPPVQARHPAPALPLPPMAAPVLQYPVPAEHGMLSDYYRAVNQVAPPSAAPSQASHRARDSGIGASDSENVPLPALPLEGMVNEETDQLWELALQEFDASCMLPAVHAPQEVEEEPRAGPSIVDAGQPQAATPSLLGELCSANFDFLFDFEAPPLETAHGMLDGGAVGLNTDFDEESQAAVNGEPGPEDSVNESQDDV